VALRRNDPFAAWKHMQRQAGLQRIEGSSASAQRHLGRRGPPFRLRLAAL